MVRPHPPNNLMQSGRNYETLDRERDRRRHDEMRSVLHQRLPGYRKRQRNSLQREHVDHCCDAILIEQGKAQHQHAAGKKMGDVEPQL
jgi:hypothetical protein